MINSKIVGMYRIDGNKIVLEEPIILEEFKRLEAETHSVLEEMTLDVTGIKFLKSSFIERLFQLFEKRKNLLVSGISDELKEIFDLVDLDGVVTYEG